MKDKGYRICSFCVMDSSDPEIIFDEQGECNHCINARRVLAAKWHPNDKGKALLESVIAEIKNVKRRNNYDCIVGMSGGIDSSYLLHFIKVEMGLNPLVIHIDAGWNSPQAVYNIKVMTEKLGLDLKEYIIDWEEMKDLQLAYLKSGLPNQDVPQDHAFFAKLYEVAKENRIKYVFTGSNLTSESILPHSWGQPAMDAVQIKYIYKKFGKGKLKNYPLVPYLKYTFYYDYIYKMKVVKPLNWIDYNKNRAMEFLIKEYGWKYYGGKHCESKWTKFFQSYYLPKRLGYDKRKAHLSSLIAAGQISRQDALKELDNKPYYNDEIKADCLYVTERLGITIDELEGFLKLKLKNYGAYKNNRIIDKWYNKARNLIYRFYRPKSKGKKGKR